MPQPQQCRIRATHLCNLHHSSWQLGILNPLSKARDWTLNFMVPSQIHFCCATIGTLSKAALGHLSMTLFGKPGGLRGMLLILSLNCHLMHSLPVTFLNYQEWDQDIQATDFFFFEKLPMHRQLKKWHLLKYTLRGFMWINDPSPGVLLFLSEKEKKLLLLFFFLWKL